MKTLGNRSYPIYIEQDLLGNAKLVKSYVKSEEVFIVTNETVAPLYLEKTQAAFKDFQTAHIVLPDSEVFKNLEVLNRIFTELLAQRFVSLYIIKTNTINNIGFFIFLN